MAKSERQDGGTRGGVGTMTRTGSRSRPVPAPGDEPLEQRRGTRAGAEVPAQRPAAGQQAARAQQQGTRQRPGPRPVPGPRVAADQRQRASARPRPAVSGRAAPDRQPAPQAQATPRAASVAPVTQQRMPFVLLLCGLLGGALVSALVISTTLAEGSFEITNLQQSANALARTRQALQEQVAQAQSAPVIEARAARLGMRPAALRYVNLTTGQTPSDLPSGWEAKIRQTGYTP